MSTAFFSEQLKLFDSGIDVARLRLVKERLMKVARSENTRRSYEHAWGVFERWCLDAGRESLPATAETVELFICWAVEEKYRVSTMRVQLAAIAALHRAAGLLSPVLVESRALVSNAARERVEEPGAKLAITPEQLRRLSPALGAEPKGVRDRALILNGFAGGLRRSELSDLRYADLRWDGERCVVLRVRKSKTDQAGEGKYVVICAGQRQATCPLRALRAWLELRGKSRGPLFTRVSQMGEVSLERVGPVSVGKIVQAALERIGEDARAYGGAFAAGGDGDGGGRERGFRSGDHAPRALEVAGDGGGLCAAGAGRCGWICCAVFCKASANVCGTCSNRGCAEGCAELRLAPWPACLGTARHGRARRFRVHCAAGYCPRFSDYCCRNCRTCRGCRVRWVTRSPARRREPMIRCPMIRRPRSCYFFSKLSKLSHLAGVSVKAAGLAGGQ